MASQQSFEKVSLTIESDVLHRVRDRVEPGKVSAYATLALRRQLERDGLDDLIGSLSRSMGRSTPMPSPGTSTSGAESGGTSPDP